MYGADHEVDEQAQQDTENARVPMTFANLVDYTGNHATDEARSAPVAYTGGAVLHAPSSRPAYHGGAALHTASDVTGGTYGAGLPVQRPTRTTYAATPSRRLPHPAPRVASRGTTRARRSTRTRTAARASARSGDSPSGSSESDGEPAAALARRTVALAGVTER